ncbi:carboxymuconolactone decarboxylase family protein [Rhodococcus sp. NPDC019627]|uniref:carboxymuconolactone decarboxylase family protein n=1 Tax=unclassified Rhodococcus (in: high G+C Gram-positive bacteria) TaxID=192944 RepID=UPI0033C941EA
MSATARIDPLPISEWSPELTDLVLNLRSTVIGDAEEADGGQPAHESGGNSAGDNVIGTLANHPSLAMAFLPFNKYLLTENTLSTRQRELLILRVAHLQQSDYEWAKHAHIATSVGFTPEDLERVMEGPRAGEWSESERVLLTAADELLQDGAISAETWIESKAHFDERQVTDLVFTVGSYSMLSMALRSFAVQTEEELRAYLPDHP